MKLTESMLRKMVVQEMKKVLKEMYNPMEEKLYAITAYLDDRADQNVSLAKLARVFKMEIGELTKLLEEDPSFDGWTTVNGDTVYVSEYGSNL